MVHVPVLEMLVCNPCCDDNELLRWFICHFVKRSDPAALHCLVKDVKQKFLGGPGECKPANDTLIAVTLYDLSTLMDDMPDNLLMIGLEKDEVILVPAIISWDNI